VVWAVATATRRHRVTDRLQSKSQSVASTSSNSCPHAAWSPDRRRVAPARGGLPASGREGYSAAAMAEWYETLFDEEFAAIWFEPRLGDATGREVAGIVELTQAAEGARILDAPCGIGRHCVALAQRGCSCVGVDLTPGYVERAKRSAESSGVAARCSFLVGDMRELPALGIPDFDGGFDLALSLFSSFGYFADEADDLAVLQGYRAALQQGGLLVVDTQCKETVLAKPNPCIARRYGDTLAVEEREYDALTDRLASTWTLVRDEQVVRRTSMTLRIYSVREWLQLLRDTGFGEIDVLDGLPGDRFRVGVSQRLVLVARRT
jgi:SAM-dependent methyltransferase